MKTCIIKNLFLLPVLATGFGLLLAGRVMAQTFTPLHSFSPLNGDSSNDGAGPGGLILSGNTLYGTGWAGGSSGYGMVFKVNTDGTSFSTLYSFNGASDWIYPGAGLVLSDSTLYGAAEGGTVFSLSFQPQLTTFPSGANVILTWPTNFAGFDYTGFTMQSTTDLASPAWTTNTVAPVIVNGQNTLTNPISGTQQFFRLSH